MSDNQNQARVVSLGREFNASNLRSRDDVACHANNEQVAEPLIENQFGRNSRVGAAEYDCKRRLSFGDFGASRLASVCTIALHFIDETRVAGAEPCQGISGWNH